MKHSSFTTYRHFCTRRGVGAEHSKPVEAARLRGNAAFGWVLLLVERGRELARRSARLQARTGRSSRPQARAEKRPHGTFVGSFKPPRANIKKAGGKGLTPFPPAWKRSDCDSLCALGPTPLAEARSALGALLAHWAHSVPPLAHQESRALRPLSAPRLLEPRRARRTAGISRRSRHRTHSGTSCKSARPSSLMLV